MQVSVPPGLLKSVTGTLKLLREMVVKLSIEGSEKPGFADWLLARAFSLHDHG